MPLLDHTRPPHNAKYVLQDIHGMWPTIILMSLNKQLPPGYRMSSRSYIGTQYELDVSAYESDEPSFSTDGGTALATLPSPTLTENTEEPRYDEYETRVYDERGDLVAAIELVSPANKDRPDTRAAFAAKCANLWNNRVCVSIVDLVATMNFNLYADTLDLLGHSDPSPVAKMSQYAITMRARNGLPKKQWRLETWAYPLEAGKPLPQLPIWLSDKQAMMLDLEATYSDTCKELRLPK